MGVTFFLIYFYQVCPPDRQSCDIRCDLQEKWMRRRLWVVGRNLLLPRAGRMNNVLFFLPVKVVLVSMCFRIVANSTITV